VQAEQLGNSFTRLHIFFFVPAQVVDYRTLPIGGPHPMMLVAVAGDATFHRITQERTTVERCLEALKNIRSFMPNFSHFEMGDSAVVHTVDRLCRAHHDVLHIFDFHMLIISSHRLIV
jgi:hypothetical protein